MDSLLRAPRAATRHLLKHSKMLQCADHPRVDGHALKNRTMVYAGRGSSLLWRQNVSAATLCPRL
jgi:hypothetical protein